MSSAGLVEGKSARCPSSPGSVTRSETGQPEENQRHQLDEHRENDQTDDRGLIQNAHQGAADKPRDAEPGVEESEGGRPLRWFNDAWHKGEQDGLRKRHADPPEDHSQKCHGRSAEKDQRCEKRGDERHRTP